MKEITKIIYLNYTLLNNCYVLMDYKNMILLNQLYQYFKNNSLNFNGKEKEE